MTATMTLDMNLLGNEGFEELSGEDLLMVDGGFNLWAYVNQAYAWVNNHAGAIGCFAVGAWGGIALTPSGSPPVAYVYNAYVGGVVGVGCYYFGKM
jgi:hypothetical protein